MAVRRTKTTRRYQRSLLVMIAAALFILTGGVHGQPLKSYESKHYLVHSNLSIQETRSIGLHMDAVYEQYVKRFSEFSNKQPKQYDLYLFRDQQQYLDFLKEYDIDGTNSGALFFTRPNIQALAAYLHERSLAQTLASLQHEGFHQFAYEHIGREMPVWINEGLAQYFEDGLLVKKTFRLGHFDTFRSEFMKQTIRNGGVVGFDELIRMDDKKWHDLVVGNPDKARIMYAQVWSIVYFLANDSQFARASLENYLLQVSKGKSSHEAFINAYGDNPRSFVQKWQTYALNLEPGSLSAATARMQFLAESLRWLEENDQPTPGSLDDLRQELQARKFKSVWQSSGFSFEMSSLDETVYEYQPVRGDARVFKLLEAERIDLPPRITAEGMRPEPTLVWARDSYGVLRHYFKYR